jgi:hypothetical protein
MFMTEAFTLAVTATLAGAALGSGLCALLNLAHLQAPLALQLFLMREEVRLLVKPSALVGAIALIAVAPPGSRCSPPSSPPGSSR